MVEGDNDKLCHQLHIGASTVDNSTALKLKGVKDTLPSIPVGHSWCLINHNLVVVEGNRHYFDSAKNAKFNSDEYLETIGDALDGLGIDHDVDVD